MVTINLSNSYGYYLFILQAVRQIVEVGERESIQWGTPESELLREAVSIVLDFGLIT